MSEKLDSTVFERVWSRVSGAPDDETVLRELIDREHECSCFLEQLAGRCRGDYAGRLLCMARQGRRHTQLLQAEHLLQTGGLHLPPKSCPRIEGTLSALSMIYRRSLEAQGSYAMQAKQTSDCCLAELYRQIAACKQAQAGAVRSMVQQHLHLR